MTEDQKKQKKKKIIVTTSVVAILLLLFLSLTMTKYKSDMTGYTEMEPALFNTTLLGELRGVTFQAGDGNDKIVGSIPLTQAMLFADNSQNLREDWMQLKPGKMVGTQDYISIPFTITNGITLDKDVAEVDIGYKLRVITTKNLPLTYKLLKRTIKSGASVTTECPLVSGEVQYVPEIGYCQQLTITKDGTNKTEEKQHILNQQAGAIAVDRYELQVSWPIRDDQGKYITTNGVRSNDVRYMKEIDIIEVRVEVESLRETEPTPGTGTVTEIAVGRIPLDDSKSYPGLELGESASVSRLGRLVVRYGNMKNNSYQFRISNGEKEFHYEVDNGYVLDSDYPGYENLQVILAVPAGDTRTYTLSGGGLESSVTGVDAGQDDPVQGEEGERIIKFTLNSIPYTNYWCGEFTLQATASGGEGTTDFTPEKKEEFRIYVTGNKVPAPPTSGETN